MSALNLRVSVLGSPVGDFCMMIAAGKVIASGFDLAGLKKEVERHLTKERIQWLEEDGETQIQDTMRRYFSGESIDVVGLAEPAWGTEFQRKVWRALERIPRGQTMSYQAIARRIGQPRAARAVGNANGANPAGVIIPCHRVVGSNGLGGYGGGLRIKRFLLNLEGIHHIPK
ncbi:MAG: methylated-DNA--[protein]-cysteine S-methyltransferase [bacterium]